ncbi:MAG: MFS transporter, partial [Gaiellaceae bacterium]
MTELVPLRRNRDFLLYQSGGLLSAFGSGISGIAYPLLVLGLTGSAAKTGYVGAVEFLPLVLLSAPAGVAADRFDRKRLLLFFYAGFVLGTLLCALSDTFPLLLG